jgi:hypothetical protein
MEISVHEISVCWILFGFFFADIEIKLGVIVYNNNQV